MIIMVIGGERKERFNLINFIGQNIPNFVVRRSIFQPIKEIVSAHNKDNKLSLLNENLPFIGDTTDFVSDEEDVLTKIEVVKDAFDLAFDKTYLLNHFNKGLTRGQFLFNTGKKDDSNLKPVFIIDDVQRKDDLLFMDNNLKDICIKSHNTLGKGLFSSMKLLMSSDSFGYNEKDRINAYEQIKKNEEQQIKQLIFHPKILKIVIKNEDDSISQTYPGATIKSLSDITMEENTIVLNSSEDLIKKSEKFSLLLYDIFYKESAIRELKGA